MHKSPTKTIDLEFSKNQILLLIISFIVISIAYFYWTWSPILAHRGGDNAYYFLIAKNLSPFSVSTAVTEYFANNNQYPVIYPLILALLGGGESILLSHVVTTAFLLIGLMVCFVWFLLEGLSFEKAFLLVVVLSLLPGIYMYALALNSEHLFLAFSMSCMVCVCMYERTNNRKYLWILTIFVVASYLTRSAGIVLLGTYIAWLYINKIDIKHKLVIIATLPFVVSQLLKKNGNSYFSSLLEKYGDSSTVIHAITTQVIRESNALWVSWNAIFSQSFTFSIVAGILLLLSLFEFVCRLRRLRFDAIYVFLYMLLIFVWPFPDEAMRFLLVIIPVLLLYIFKSYLYLLGKLSIDRKLGEKLTYMLPLILVVMLLPNLAYVINRFGEKLPNELVIYKRLYTRFSHVNREESINYLYYEDSLANSFKKIGEYVPLNECVYSIKPSVAGLYGERISLIPPRESLNDEEFFNELDKSHCSYIHMYAENSPSYKDQFYPLSRVKDVIELLDMSLTGVEKPIPVSAYLGFYSKNQQHPILE